MSMFITFVMIVINEILHIVMRSNIFNILKCKWGLGIVFAYSNNMLFYKHSHVILIFGTSVKINCILGDFLWPWPNKLLQKYILFIKMIVEISWYFSILCTWWREANFLTSSALVIAIPTIWLQHSATNAWIARPFWNEMLHKVLKLLTLH